jgi:hypothetical protein
VHELEFIPDWYPRTRRKRMAVIFQAWATLAVVLIASACVFAKHRSVRAAEGRLGEILASMNETREDLRKLDDLLKLEQQWRQRDQVLIKLGMHVESTRLIDKLEEVMPREMSVLELELTTDETKPQRSGTLARLVDITTPDLPPDRRMNVRLRGVAPTDVDLATFIMRLSDVPFFENVTPNYAKDRSDSGHLMREYEITFTLNLNAPAVN